MEQAKALREEEERTLSAAEEICVKQEIFILKNVLIEIVLIKYVFIR